MPLTTQTDKNTDLPKLSEKIDDLSLKLPKRPGQTKAQKNTEKNVKLPEDILKAATEKGIERENIKLQGGMWIACTDTQCIPLGKANTIELPRIPLETQLKQLPVGSTLIVDGAKKGSRSEFVLSKQEVLSGGAAFGLPEFGTFSKNPNGTYTFSKSESLVGELRVELPKDASTKATLTNDAALARSYVESHPQEAILVLATAPEICPPCKQAENDLPPMLKELKAEGHSITFIRVEYSDFATAKQDFGADAKFPHFDLFSPAEQEALPNTILSKNSNMTSGLTRYRGSVEGLPENLKQIISELDQKPQPSTNPK